MNQLALVVPQTDPLGPTCSLTSQHQCLRSACNRGQKPARGSSCAGDRVRGAWRIRSSSAQISQVQRKCRRASQTKIREVTSQGRYSGEVCWVPTQHLTCRTFPKTKCPVPSLSFSSLANAQEQQYLGTEREREPLRGHSFHPLIWGLCAWLRTPHANDHFALFGQIPL